MLIIRWIAKEEMGCVYVLVGVYKHSVTKEMKYCLVTKEIDLDGIILCEISQRKMNTIWFTGVEYKKQNKWTKQTKQKKQK